MASVAIVWALVGCWGAFLAGFVVGVVWSSLSQRARSTQPASPSAARPRPPAGKPTIHLKAYHRN